MTGKFIEFINPQTGQVINRGSEFYKVVGITHYQYSCMMRGQGSTGTIKVDGVVWHFVKHFKNLELRKYKPVAKGTKRSYTMRKVRSESPIEIGDREYREIPDEAEIYSYRTIGNYLCTYSISTGRLVSTSWIDGECDEPIKPIMPAPGETTIIDKILSGEIFINMKIV